MAKVDYDGVIQAAHYDDQGQVEWVRAYLRRGAVWTDYILLPRAELVEKIQSGLKFRTGERLEYQGGTFNTFDPVRVVQSNSHEVLVAGGGSAESDKLDGVPRI